MNEGIINEEASVEKGENARMASFVGAIAIADLVKSTLGPKGMDKILQSVSSKEGKIEVTNDGATILRSVHIDNAAAKVLVDIAKTQDEEVGDGTTSVAVLCGELLREAEKLIDARVHPQTIAAGWRLAAKLAKAELEKAATRETDEEKFRERLMEIARTTLSSKLVLYEKEHFAKLAVDAVLRLKGSDNLDYIQLLKKPGGQLGDSYLAEGFVLDKKIGIGQPKRLEKAKARAGVRQPPPSSRRAQHRVDGVWGASRGSHGSPRVTFDTLTGHGREHGHGHGQDQDLWRARQGRLAVEGSGHRTGREGQDGSLAVSYLLHAIGATRLHHTRPRVVYFLILRRFGPRRGRRGVSERPLS